LRESASGRKEDVSRSNAVWIEKKAREGPVVVELTPQKMGMKDHYHRCASLDCQYYLTIIWKKSLTIS